MLCNRYSKLILTCEAMQFAYVSVIRQTRVWIDQELCMELLL